MTALGTSPSPFHASLTSELRSGKRAPGPSAPASKLPWGSSGGSRRSSAPGQRRRVLVPRHSAIASWLDGCLTRRSRSTARPRRVGSSWRTVRAWYLPMNSYGSTPNRMGTTSTRRQTAKPISLSQNFDSMIPGVSHAASASQFRSPTRSHPTALRRVDCLVCNERLERAEARGDASTSPNG